jgi:hypothetical protein
MFNDKRSFFIFFFIILVVSITPASAWSLSEACTNPLNTNPNIVIQDKKPTLDNETSLKAIEKETSQIQGYSDSLNHDLEYVKSRAGDYGWKFWKWPKITADIIKTLFTMTDTANKMSGTSVKLQDEANKLNAETKSGSNNNGNAASYEEDARYMANELTKLMNTTFTAKKVKASELKKGDIVQYISQGKYPRYLEVIDIIYPENTTKNTERQILNQPDNTPIIILKGTGDKTIPIPCIDECTELTPPNTTDFRNTLQNTVQLQETQINQTLKDAGKTEKTGKKLKTGYTVCFRIATALGSIAAISAAVALTTTPIPPVSAPIWAMAGTLTGTAGVVGIIGGILYGIYKSYEDKANELENSANLNKQDLTNYTKLDERVYNMNVSVFEGIPTIKKPPINNWKELQGIVVKNPHHGDLLLGPGLQFLYGPHKDYIGEDQFKIQIINKYGQMLGYLVVNVHIKPIPVLEIPPEA